MSAVLSFSESPELARELSTAAASLAAALGVSTMSVRFDQSDGVSEGLATLLVRSDQPMRGSIELVADGLAKTAERKGSPIVLIGATRFGRQVAGSLAVKTGRPVLSDVRAMATQGDGAEGSPRMVTGAKTAFAGKFNAKVGAPVPCIATVPRGAYEAAAPGSPSTETLDLSGAGISPKVRHMESKPKQQSSSVDLKAARVIVAAGRGFKKKEDLLLVEELASALGGMVGASRPLSSDLGWLGEERHIGLTGIYVHPELYVAVGISGQLQHVAGIKDSKLIVAINKDKQAPIFHVADYGIVGDLYQVVPALVKALQKERAGK